MFGQLQLLFCRQNPSWEHFEPMRLFAPKRHQIHLLPLKKRSCRGWPKNYTQKACWLSHLENHLTQIEKWMMYKWGLKLATRGQTAARRIIILGPHLRTKIKLIENTGNFNQSFSCWKPDKAQPYPDSASSGPPVNWIWDTWCIKLASFFASYNWFNNFLRGGPLKTCTIAKGLPFPLAKYMKWIDMK